MNATITHALVVGLFTSDVRYIAWGTLREMCELQEAIGGSVVRV